MSDGFLLLLVQTVSNGSANLADSHSFTVSPSWGYHCDAPFSLSIRFPEFGKNRACRIAIRHQTVSGGDVNIATHPVCHCRTAMHDSVSVPVGEIVNE